MWASDQLSIVSSDVALVPASFLVTSKLSKLDQTYRILIAQLDLGGPVQPADLFNLYFVSLGVAVSAI